jgi:type III secretion protein D
MNEPISAPVRQQSARLLPRYKLRVLSGSLRGREFTLAPGNWVIGGVDADLAVVLERNQSAVLEIDDEGVHLRGSIDCWIRGRRVEPNDPLPHNVSLDLAGFAVAVGEINADLSEIQPVSRHTPMQWVAGGSIACALLAAGITLGALFMFFPVASERTQAQAQAAWIAQITQKFAEQHVSAQIGKDGVLQLSGYCANSDQVDMLLNQLRQRGTTFSDNIICMSDVAREILDTLSLYGYRNVYVRPSTVAGRYEIVGPISKGLGWSTVEEQLQRIPGVTSWEVRDLLGPYSVEMVNRIRQAGLGPYVSVVPSGQDITISGELSPDRLAILNRLIETLRHGADSQLSIAYEDIPIDNVTTKVLESPIVTYIGNSISPSVQLANGAVLRTGSLISSGYTVSRLDTDGIDLTRNGRLIHFPSAILSNYIPNPPGNPHVPDLP